MAARLGREAPADPAAAGPRRHKTVDEMALEAAVPRQKEGYDEPGAAFVAGVTEVPLGVEHRLKNIEATEAAKAALLAKGRGGRFDDDEGGGGYGGGGGSGFARAQFPVRFGRMSEREQAVVAQVGAKKAAARTRAVEKKREKEGSFKGFF